MKNIDNVELLKERFSILSRERETAKRILESAVDSLGFSVIVNEEYFPEALLEEGARKIRTFITFDALVFFVFSPDGLGFSLSYCDPEEKLPFFEKEMIPLVEDRTFAWVIDRNRPVIITASDGKRQILLHSMTTQNRTMGMFMGLLGEDETAILDLSFAFLTVSLSSMAGILQNAELYSMIRGLNGELSKKIEHLEESERNLAEAMQARDIFLANVSHDIRTPLNGIMGMTALLEGTILDSHQKKMVRILKDESSSLLRLINDLLDFSKIEAGKLTFENALFSLRELWKSVRESFLSRARQKKLEFRMELKGSIPDKVWGDSLRLRQILGNLVENALKFTPRGDIEVFGDVSPSMNGQVTFSVKVRDTGIGISESVAQQLFRPFVQGDPSTTRKFGGTGLGLVISKRLVEGMGGTISFESIEGRGSVFYFSIPLRYEGECVSGSTTDPFAERTLPLDISVLVVEDNETSRLVAASMLQMLGIHNVEMAENGAEAIEKLSARRYDLILMDIQMPVMDGVEVVKVVRDLSSSVLDHDVPVVAMTANILTADRERYFCAGISDYIAKPILPDDLYALLTRLCSGRVSSPSSIQQRETREAERNEAVFRWQIFLKRMGEDVELCSRTVNFFIMDSLKLLAALRRTVKSKNGISETKMKAHALRGAAVNVEACELASIAAEVEAAAEQNDVERMMALLPDLANARKRFLFEAARGNFISLESGNDEPKG